MKTLFIRDIKLFFQKFYYLLIPLFLFIIYIITDYQNPNIENNLGIFTASTNELNNLLLYSLSLSINGVYLLFAYYIYQYDIKQKEVIFLRISYSKWILTNIIFQVFLCIALLLITTFSYFLYSLLFSFSYSIEIIMLLKIFLSKFLFVNLALLLYKLLNKNGLIIITILLILPLLFSYPSLFYVYHINTSSSFILLLELLAITFSNLLLYFLKDRNLIIKNKRKDNDKNENCD